MIRSLPSTPALAAAVLCLLPVTGWAAAGAASATNGAEARVDAIALYNQGAAVVQDSRDVPLDGGDQQIAWPVSGRLRPDTLWLQGEGVRLTGFAASALADDDVDPLAARIGQSVTLVRDGAVHDAAASRAATLVALAGGAVYVRLDGRMQRISADSPWQITWPVDAGERSAAGGLQLDIDADAAGRQALTATYQIDGPSWQASYTGRFDAASGRLALQGMAVIDNSGGAALHADRAWLVAGDVARSNAQAPQPMMMARSEAKMSDSAPQAAGDTYRYPLDGALYVPAGGMRAVAMMDRLSFSATRSYRIENSWYAASREDVRSHAEVRLRFDNSSDRPLPAGVLRVYDGEGEARLMGEDRIADTPTGAPVTLTLGRSFDITAERRLLADDTTHAGQHERRIRIMLHNASGQKAPVEVVEQLPQAAHIVSSSTPAADDSPADTAAWRLDVPAGGRAELTYTVQWPVNG